MFRFCKKKGRSISFQKGSKVQSVHFKTLISVDLVCRCTYTWILDACTWYDRNTKNKRKINKREHGSSTHLKLIFINPIFVTWKDQNTSWNLWHSGVFNSSYWRSPSHWQFPTNFNFFSWHIVSYRHILSYIVVYIYIVEWYRQYR